jgi:hypothetical protein
MQPRRDGGGAVGQAKYVKHPFEATLILGRRVADAEYTRDGWNCPDNVKASSHVSQQALQPDRPHRAPIGDELD